MPEFQGWLKKSPKYMDKAFCGLCQSELRAHFTDLRTHAKSRKHLKAMEDKNSQKSAASIFTKQIAVKATEEEKVNQRELRLALFIACKASIRSMDDLGEIIQQEFPSSIQLHRTKCAALIRNVLGPHFMSEFKNDLQNSFFSLMVDESTDVSTTKLMAFSARYYSERFKTIKETFMCLREVVYCDAKTLTLELKDTLHQWRLNPELFIGLGTDGASNMIAKDVSLQNYARQEYPNLTHVRCTAHSLDLAAKDAVKFLPSNLEFMIRESYNWFAHSVIRQNEYRQVLDLVGFEALNDEMDEELLSMDNLECPSMEDQPQSLPSMEAQPKKVKKPLKLLSISNTRWLVVADCAQRILTQYDALTAMFDMAQNSISKSYETRLLSDMFKDEKNRIYLHFLTPLLLELKRMTKLFQERTVNTMEIYQELDGYFMALARRILKNETIRQHENSSIKLCSLTITDFVLLGLEDVDFGQLFMRGVRKFDNGTKRDMKIRCQKFMIELFIGLQKRMDKTLLTVKTMTPFTLPLFKMEAPGLEHFKHPFFKTDPVSLGQYETLVGLIQASRPLMEENDTTENFWIKVHNWKVGDEYKFRFLSDGVIKMMCLPLSNAEVERTFSATSHVKWWRRAQMKKDLLESSMHCIFGLKWMDKSLKDWIPPRELLHYDKKHLYD